MYRRMAALRRVAPRSWKKLGLALAFVLVVFPALALGQEQIPANELMRQTVTNELKAAGEPGHYMYRLRTETPRRSETKTMIQNKDWLIGRLIEVDDKPLSPSQRRQEDQRLDRILRDPKRLSDEQQKQRKDEKKVWDILRVFPEAFLFKYAETAGRSDAEKVVRLAFRPNPAFQPASRESAALRGAKGSVSIDPTTKRVIRIDATLFRPVDFGWGILARLDQGGNFTLEEGKTEGGGWALKTVHFHFTGKILLFKNLRVDKVMKTSNFRLMPDSLTLAEGLELLRNQDETMTPTARSQ